MNDRLDASDPQERVASIDVLRGVALFGVLAVNLVTEFRVSIFQQFLPDAGPAERYDRFAEAFVRIALESKAFALFSFLFGVSLAILYERLSRTGRPLYWLSRRLAVLLAFGLVHLLLIWNGDILTEYAIAGFLVLPLLAMSTTVVAVSALFFLLLFIAVPTLPIPVEWPSQALLREHVAEANRVYAVGTFPEIWRFSIHELPLIFPLHVQVFARTVASFLAGALAWRTGLFRREPRNVRRLLAIAVSGCAIGGALVIAEYGGVELSLGWLGPFRNLLVSLGPVVLALGYGAALIAFMQTGERAIVSAALAPIGRMAFTNYILQSLVFGFIFFGYGLGYFGRLGAFSTLVLGIAVFAMQCWLSAVWLRHYRFGPLEWLWRSLMYGHPQAMRRRRMRS